MSLNIGKCQVLTTCRLHTVSKFDYQLDSKNLDNVNQYKYLGIYVTSDLSWDTHINYICSKANRALGFIKRQLGKCTQEVKLKAYLTLVRPHLEFASSCSCAWDPHFGVLVDQLEMVQRKAVRFVLNKYSRDESVTEMLAELKLCSLELRRKQARLRLLFKIDHKETPLVTPLQLRLKSLQRRNDNGHSYHHFVCHSEPFFSSFYPRTVRDWNALNSDLVSVSDIDTFSAHLEKMAASH